MLAVAAVASGALVITTAASAADHAVTVQNFAYNPASITVNVGDSVTWTNQDKAPHTVTADDGSFDQPLAANGGTATITFNTVGTFPYTCTIHPNMHGTVIVAAAANSPTASPAIGGATNTPATGGANATNTPASGATGGNAGGSGNAPSAPPATGSGVAPASSSLPLMVVLGGVLIAIGLGSGVLAVSRRRD
jgi:plastocyanin